MLIFIPISIIVSLIFTMQNMILLPIAYINHISRSTFAFIVFGPIILVISIPANMICYLISLFQKQNCVMPKADP